MIVVKNTGEVIDTVNFNELCDIDEKSPPVIGL